MRTDKDRKFRKTARDFKGHVERMKNTPIQVLENMFLELYNFGLEEFIKVEKEKHPDKTRREIILDMYKLHDKLKNLSRKVHAKQL